MVREEDELPHVLHAVSARDVQLVHSQFEGLPCPVDDCESFHREVATVEAGELDGLDEPMLLSQSDTAYRLRLSGMGGPLVVRIERTGTQTMLVVKVAQGEARWQPEVQTLRRRSKALSESEWKRLTQALHAYGFWGRPSWKLRRIWKDEKGVVHGLGGFDGVNVSLEGLDSGRRHFVHRTFSFAEPGLEELVSVFRELASCEGLVEE